MGKGYFSVGSRVKVMNRIGEVRGWAVETDSSGLLTPLYLIALDQGAYLDDDKSKMYISTIVAAFDNVEAENG